MYILLLLNVVGVALMISKFFALKKEKDNCLQVAESLGAQIKRENKDSTSLIEMAKQSMSTYSKNMEKGLNTIKVIASISPLLGLLGTVVGVLIAFRVMAQTGLSDPSHFAHGISMALITTVGGLIVAIPHFIGHHYLVGMLETIEAKVEQALLEKVL